MAIPAGKACSLLAVEIGEGRRVRFERYEIWRS